MRVTRIAPGADGSCQFDEHATRTVDGPAEMLFFTLPEGNGWHIGP